ncbi:hypothetical protein HOY80DRAFT_1033530 [Tuber brumale]|nr:hypothetical protein HOY80DRAFT_1033530 [Tuber brumale]
MERGSRHYQSGNSNSFNISVNSHNTTVTGEELRVLVWISPLEAWKRHQDMSAAGIGGVVEWVLETTLPTGLQEAPEEVTAEAFRTVRGRVGRRALQLEKLVELFPPGAFLFRPNVHLHRWMDEFAVVENRAKFLQTLEGILEKSANIWVFLTDRPHI